MKQWLININCEIANAMEKASQFGVSEFHFRDALNLSEKEKECKKTIN